MARQSKTQWDDHVEWETLKIPRLRIPRAPWRKLYAATGGDKKTEVPSTRDATGNGCTPATYLPQNHCQVYDERVGGFSHSHLSSRTPQLFLTTWDVSRQEIGSSSEQVHNILGISTSGAKQTIEKGTGIAELGRHVDAYTKCEGTGGISTVDESQELQCTRQGLDGHETVQTGSSWKCESVLAWLRVRVEFNCVLQSCTSRFYLVDCSCVVRDEHTALVKIGNVASKHVWRAVSGTYRWWKPGYRDLLSYVMWWLVLLVFFFQHA